MASTNQFVTDPVSPTCLEAVVEDETGKADGKLRLGNRDASQGSSTSQ